MIPHFEKMLYDNAQLLNIYADAYAITQKPLFEKVIAQTSDWVRREMQSREGGYFSSLDADSAGTEGKYYYWDRDEIKNLLDDAEFTIIDKQFGLEHAPNFFNYWHLCQKYSVTELSELFAMPLSDVQQISQQAFKKLQTARAFRVPPGRDEKILPAWNGLMIRGMAKAGMMLNDKDCIDSAERAVNFIKNTMWVDGRLFASYNNKTPHLMAYLDDYIFLIDGLITLLQARWRNDLFYFVQEIADAVINHFYDNENGGFYFTAHDHEKLLTRPKQFMDEALPSGNGVAAKVFLNLGYLVADQRYINVAEGILKSAASIIKTYPSAYDNVLTALMLYKAKPELVVVRAQANELAAWQQTVYQRYNPQGKCFGIDSQLNDLPKSLASYEAKDKAHAYICKGEQCQAPVSTIAELDKRITS